MGGCAAAMVSEVLASGGRLEYRKFPATIGYMIWPHHSEALGTRHMYFLGPGSSIVFLYGEGEQGDRSQCKSAFCHLHDYSSVGNCMKAQGAVSERLRNVT